MMCSIHSDHPKQYFCKSENMWFCELCMKNHSKCEYPYYYEDILQRKQAQESLGRIGGITQNTACLSTAFTNSHKIIKDLLAELKTTFKNMENYDHTTLENNLSSVMFYSQVLQLTNGNLVFKCNESLSKASSNITNSLEGFKEKLALSIPIFDQSSILSELDIKKILKWIKPEKPPRKSFVKIFDASEADFDAAEFHKCCDNVNPTILVVKTNHGQIIGGYTQLSWGLKGCVPDGTLKTFIFSMSLKKRFGIKTQNEAIFAEQTHGPIFGNYNIPIVNKCNTIECEPKFGGFITEEENNKLNFFGGSKFTVENYEIFTIKK